MICWPLDKSKPELFGGRRVRALSFVATSSLDDLCGSRCFRTDCWLTAAFTRTARISLTVSTKEGAVCILYSQNSYMEGTGGAAIK